MNAVISERVVELPDEKAGDFQTGYDIWDLGRIFRSEASGKTRENLDIDLTGFVPSGLPCLPAHTGEGGVRSFLLVMPGNLVADLYGLYGERLLEQNVRTFLQFRGKINKGIRNTIVHQPGMFFSYNNGLSATAEDVVLDPDTGNIVAVRNLQIVNGGQTTASIFTARRNDKAGLSEVHVQVKLSVIAPAEVETVVPKISEYSNTQNRVNAADFFANHPFHLRIEEFSRRIWAPSPEGGVQQSHWFYERARGQFANQQAHLSPAEKRRFLAQNPRSQMFTKTDLAKFVLSFDESPQEVSLGAQKAFSGTPRTKGLVRRVSAQWEKDDTVFHETWFKRTIGMAVLFRGLDRAVLKAPWYGGYKANIVTYTLAKFSSLAGEAEQGIDLLGIWDLQRVPEVLLEFLLQIAAEVDATLRNPPDGVTTNVSEWAKKDLCWTRIRELEMAVPEEILRFLLDAEHAREEHREGKRTQVIQSSIQIQSEIVERGAEFWKQLREWNRGSRKLSPKEIGVLNIACSLPRKVPTERQCAVLQKAERRARQEGFFPEE